MSYNTELQSNNAELQEILDAVNDLPDAGGGGGGVETCTIILRPDSDAALYIYGYTHTLNDGSISASLIDYGTGVSNTEITLNNVVCGSLVMLAWDGISRNISTSISVEWLGTFERFKAPSTNGVLIVDLIGDD